MSRARTLSKEIHLLVFGLRWPPETFIRAKLERLAARGVRITVACADSVKRPPGASVDGIRVERVIPAGRLRPFGLLAALLRLAVTRPGRIRAVVRAAHAPAGQGRPVRGLEALGRLRTYARLASLQPNVVHFEWNTAAVHFHSLVDALGCASVVSVRGGDLEIYPHGPATMVMATGYPAAFQQAAVVHCVSEAAKEEALAYGLLGAKARVIRPAVDPSRFRPRASRRADGTFRVVAVGWLHWRKGWEYALEAVARLVAEGIPVAFDVVGPEPSPEMATRSDRERIQHTIYDLGLGGNVRVHGPLEHSRVLELLQEAHVFLHTSLAEGIPNVVLEAMACGIPVVATDVGGTREVLTDGVEGYLVAPRDVPATARALGELWRDPQRRRSMGEAGRARVATDLGLDRQTDRWLELYEDVVAAAAPARTLRLIEVGLAWPPETFLRRKLQGLAERGADVAVASILREGVRPRWVAGTSLERLPHWAEPRRRLLAGLTRDAVGLLLTDRARLRSLLRAWRAMPPEVTRDKRWVRLARLHLRLARIRADVAHFEWASFAVTCSPLFRVWDFPVVVSCHGSEVLVHPSGEWPVDLAALFRQVDSVHCVSRAVERAAAPGLDGARVEVIPSAVDPNVFRPPARERPDDGEFVVVTISALRWIKGYEYGIGAIARLAEAGVPVRYEIVGSEPLEGAERGESGRILAAVEELGLADRVRLRGHLTEREVVGVLQCSDAFLQASLSEGMPTAVLEAMACGLPVVATDVGGTREAVTDGVEGYLVPPRDPRAAAEALARLWRDPALRRTMGGAGRSRVVAELTLERQLDRFEAMYRELARS